MHSLEYHRLLNIPTLGWEEAVKNYFLLQSARHEIYICDQKNLATSYFLKLAKSISPKTELVERESFEDLKSEKNHLLIFPSFEFRVFNFNFNRTLKKEFGEPYLVFVDSNSAELVEKDFSERGLKVHANLLKNDLGILKAYIFSSEFQLWMNQKKCPFPHNDNFDQDFIKAKAKSLELDGFSYSERALSLEHLRGIETNNVKRSLYPLHRFFQKYLNTETSINQNEQRIYGTVS